MAQRTGQKTGQAPPVGFSWGDYVSALVAEAGTLTAIAWKLAERGAGPEDVASIERALRRMRERGQRDGGSWGQRLLRTFGVPRAVEDRLRFMGLYHSPFNDLALPVCLDQLRLFDRPPLSESRARVWLQLGFASAALRAREFERAGSCLARAAEVAALPQDAQLEAALAQLAGQDRNRKRVQAIETELQLARNSMSGGWKHVGQMEAAQLAQWLANTESLILTRGVEPTAPPS